jgi:hypothetical protein
MNKTEAAYAEVLQQAKMAGEIVSYRFEEFRLKLADNLFFTPDFQVITSDGEMQFHEVKACRSDGKMLIEDDARVKIKVAADKFWEFQFFLKGKLPAKAGGGWKTEEFA